MNSYIKDLKFRINHDEDFENRLINFQGNIPSITSSILSKFITGLDQDFIQRMYFDRFLIQKNLLQQDKDFLKKIKKIEKESTLAIGLLINRICRSIKQKKLFKYWLSLWFFIIFWND